MGSAPTLSRLQHSEYACVIEPTSSRGGAGSKNLTATVSLDRIEAVVDLSRYPIHEPGSAAGAALIRGCVEQLADDGCCVIEAFVRPCARAGLAREAEALAPLAHRSSVEHNPYFSPVDERFAPGHPRRTFQRRSNGFICADLIPADSDLWAIFMLPEMTEFLRRTFGKEQLYRYEDPLAQMPINTMRPGDEFPWHFDTNEFTVTIMLQLPEEGGEFEYAPNIRSPRDECYEAVAEVLAGERNRVRRLRLREGDVQLFMGRFTLHRVTRVECGRSRHVAIPLWAAAPGMIGQPHRTQQIYGRLTDAHRPAMVRSDGLAD